jgi:hypothetical protein
MRVYKRLDAEKVKTRTPTNRKVRHQHLADSRSLPHPPC